ncbi:MAG: D-alanyl-D-alanine carboxypeptidase [Clostridium sp.]|nr:D-alanyl-D-alanine carboxypeptidase [Clostridium sp.]
MEATTGRVLCGQNIHQQLPMASTTKIIGAMMVLEQPNLHDYFLVDPDAIQVEGSSMGLMEGDMVSLYALACGMLLPSGNDAANAAGVRLYGSIEGFVEAMNRRAQQLGLADTHYVTACGLDAPEHYSTAFDLAKLTRVALQNEDFAHICSQPSMQVRFGAPPYERWLKNYNRLLTLYPDCIGVKTGFTDDAGRCLVSAAERNGMTLICVTLNAQDDWNLHASLYDRCFSRYSMQPLVLPPVHTTLVGSEIQSNGIETPIPLLPAWQPCVPLRQGESARLQSRLIAQPFLYPPTASNQVCGLLEYTLDNQLLCSVPLVAGE